MWKVKERKRVFVIAHVLELLLGRWLCCVVVMELGKSIAQEC